METVSIPRKERLEPKCEATTVRAVTKCSVFSVFFTPGELLGRTEPFFRGYVRGRAEAGTLACCHQTRAVGCT